MFATQTPALAGRKAKAQIKGQINSRSKARSRSRALLRSQGLAPVAKEAWGKASHTPIARLQVTSRQGIATLPSSPVPYTPGEAWGCRAAASGRALDPLKSGVEPSGERSKKVHSAP